MSEAQRGAQRAAAAAAADKDAGERRLQDAEAKIQELMAEVDRRNADIKCALIAAFTAIALLWTSITCGNVFCSS